jgi:GDPmannose 4,6-dehydratase
MLQQKEPDDYILATGETHSVREFIEECARLLDLGLTWKGKGLKEEGYSKKLEKTIIKIDPKYFRPAEVDILLGDPSKARRKLKWVPKTKFKDLARIMLEADLQNEGLELP